MTYVVSHVAAAAALALLFHLTGTLTLTIVPSLRHVGQRTGFLPISMGLLVWVYLLFTLAAFGMYHPQLLRFAAAVAGAAGLAAAIRTRQHSSTTSPPSWSGRLLVSDWLSLFGLASMVCVLVGLTLLPLPGWDDMTYHLAVPKLFLGHGGFFYVPFNVYSNWPLGMELLYGLAMAVQDYVTAKLLHTAMLVLLLVAMYRFTARRHASWVAALACALFLANDVVLSEATWAYVDIAIAFFLFIATTLVVEYRDTGARAALAAAGVCCGAVATFKITGISVVPCVAALTIAATTARPGVRPRSVLINVAIVSVPPVVLLAPWIAKAYHYTGNPVYPFLWNVFGGPDWNAALSDQFTVWQQSIGAGRRPLDYLLLPVRVILGGGPEYGRFGAAISKGWMIWLELIGIGWSRINANRVLLIPAGVYFAIWAVSSQQMRFLIPILPLLSVVSASAVDAVVSRLVASGARETSALTTAARLIATVAIITLLVVEGAPSIVAAVRRVPSMVSAPPDLARWSPDPVYPVVNELPPDSRLLLLDTNHGLFIDRRYVADSFFEASQIASLFGPSPTAGQIDHALAGLGVTHVLVGPQQFVDFPPQLWAYLDDSARARKLYGSAGTYRLYALSRTAR